MSPFTTSPAQPASTGLPEWVSSHEGQQLCHRIGHVFPLSPDTSIRRVLRRAVEVHGPDASSDALVLDAVSRLRDALHE